MLHRHLSLAGLNGGLRRCLPLVCHVCSNPWIAFRVERWSGRLGSGYRLKAGLA
jgi:hypothetical protein